MVGLQLIPVRADSVVSPKPPYECRVKSFVLRYGGVSSVPSSWTWEGTPVVSPVVDNQGKVGPEGGPHT